MKVTLFDAHPFERIYFSKANEKFRFELKFMDVRLKEDTVNLVEGCDVVCSFVNDRLNRTVLEVIQKSGIQLIALRSAGYNHIDLRAAQELGIRVVRVPEYSPYAVAEHAVALILALNRKIYRAHERVKEGNFSLDNLIGFDLHGKTVGIMGTGRIGSVMAKIMLGFGCKVIAYDLKRNSELEKIGLTYVPKEEIFRQSDIISLHTPLTPETRHLINTESLSLTKKGVMLINTGRGALIDSRALIDSLKSGHIGYAGLDVYEEEEGIFFKDLSNQIIQDDTLARLLTFPNVLITSHQAFLTHEALTKIAETTLQNINDYIQKRTLINEVLAPEAATSKERFRPQQPNKSPNQWDAEKKI